MPGPIPSGSDAPLLPNLSENENEKDERFFDKDTEPSDPVVPGKEKEEPRFLSFDPS
jgi:hypothetical protein